MKNKILVVLFLGYIFIFAIAGVIVPDKELSNSERRPLKKFPEFEFTSDWISDVDGYLLDHFVGRDTFRSIKANYNYKVLGKLDNNKVYLKDNYIYKSNYPTNLGSIKNFIRVVSKLEGLLSEDNKTYIMIVPDKNYYLDSKDFLHLDYDLIYKEVKKLGIKEIDVRDILEIDSYYETDTHWRQEKLDGVVEALSKTMGFKYRRLTYKENVYNNFYGVYYGDSAISRSPEKLVYLTNEIFDVVSVKYFGDDKVTTVYNTDKLTGMDAYDVYLNGETPYFEITNPKATSKKELVIFRDSFGRSLTPLLIDSYSKITVFDNRYMISSEIEKYIEFTDQDVLFEYSTLVVNESGSLKG